MTRSMTLINSSNWENEDYIVEIEREDGTVVQTRLKPGEHFIFQPDDQHTIRDIREDEPSNPVPFRTNRGDQIVVDVAVNKRVATSLRVGISNTEE